MTERSTYDDGGGAPQFLRGMVSGDRRIGRGERDDEGRSED